MKNDLQKYLSETIERLMADAIKATLNNPRESLFLLSFAAASRRAAKTREGFEKEGEHIPPFLIASITRDCNLHCAGCFAHANNNCAKDQKHREMTVEEWDGVFAEAETLGISFIFLVGGEPMLCRDVIESAGHHGNILFPIITNGIFMDDEYIRLFDKHRNLLPMISIEGKQEATDQRRGKGIYDQLLQTMERLSGRKIPFGVSITVTTDNYEEVTESGFLELLRGAGCKLVLYVEYVATEESDGRLEPGEDQRAYMEERLAQLRKACDDVLFLSFPGDENAYGGCLAAGRGFFHISAEGDAEPCPFAPFSDINVRETSLREAIRSRLFGRLEARDMLQEDHAGGCALSGKSTQIQELLKSEETQT